MEKYKIKDIGEFIGSDGIKVPNDIIMQWIRVANEEERYEDSQRYYQEIKRRQNEYFVLELSGGGNNTLNGEWSVIHISHDVETEPGFSGYNEAKQYVMDELSKQDHSFNYLIVGWNDFECQEIKHLVCGQPGVYETRRGYNLKNGIFKLDSF